MQEKSPGTERQKKYPKHKNRADVKYKTSLAFGRGKIMETNCLDKNAQSR